MPFKTVIVESVADYLRQIDEECHVWTVSDSNSYFAFPWFRGQANADWPLIPSYYRFKEAKEENLRAEFARKGLPFLVDSAPASEWEWYFLMQHYGVPTRLLDWTEAALFALYFATRDRHMTADAAVWMFDPWWFNSIIAGKEELFYTDEPEAQPYLPSLRSGKGIPEHPLAIIPRHISRRIVVQRGCFTIFGSARRPIEKICDEVSDPRLVKFHIPAKVQSGVRENVLRAGVSETTLFPDLVGLSHELRSWWLENW